jgi:hypothetical protein
MFAIINITYVVFRSFDHSTYLDDQGRIERMIDGRMDRDVRKGGERSEGIKEG